MSAAFQDCDEARERIEPAGFIGGVNHEPKVRAAARARRLEQEARNCIAIAIGQSGGFSADLIDEALRLHARARELSMRGRGKWGAEAPANDAAPPFERGNRSGLA